jgi:hypothetical protein
LSHFGDQTFPHFCATVQALETKGELLMSAAHPKSRPKQAPRKLSLQHENSAANPDNDISAEAPIQGGVFA